MSTATADGEEIGVWRMMASILSGVAGAVGVFAMSHNLLVALGAYIFVTCLVFAVLWVIGHE